MSSQAPSSPVAPVPSAPSKSVSATAKQLVSIPLATIFEPTDIDPLMMPIADINSSRSWDLTKLTIHFAVIRGTLSCLFTGYCLRLMFSTINASAHYHMPSTVFR